MSATNTPLQGSLVNIQLKPDGTDASAYKFMVCQSDYTLDIDVPNSTTDTNCGSLLSTGIAKFTLSANGVFNTGYDSSTQLSLNQLIAWATANPSTLLNFLAEYPLAGTAGSTYLRTGQCRITKIGETGSTDDFIKYSITFTGNGTLTAGGI